MVGAQEGQQRSNFPVVEWTVYLRNAGKAVTPILTDIQALDVAFQRAERSRSIEGPVHNRCMAKFFRGRERTQAKISKNVVLITNNRGRLKAFLIAYAC